MLPQFNLKIDIIIANVLYKSVKNRCGMRKRAGIKNKSAIKDAGTNDEIKGDL